MSVFDEGVGDSNATCPPPSDVRAQVTCSYSQSGLQCPGNPQVCDGTLFFDALVCNGSVWVTVAGTVCGDEGGPDADDGGPPVLDASWPWETSDTG
jgi:hypothetical protein